MTRDPLAIEAYVRQRLTDALSRDGKSPPQWQEESIAEAARLVGAVEADDRQFLFAKLAIHEVLAHQELLHPRRRRDLTVLLSGDHRALFTATVARLDGLSPTAVPLLHALALSRGRGFPRAAGVWATAAAALSDGVPVTDVDIGDLLVQAAPYIMVDSEEQCAVYRLAHQIFRECLITGIESHNGWE